MGDQRCVRAGVDSVEAVAVPDKGVGLGIVTGMLATLLSGASYGTALGNMVDGPRAGEDGHLFVAIDIAAFRPVADFKRQVDAISR